MLGDFIGKPVSMQAKRATPRSSTTSSCCDAGLRPRDRRRAQTGAKRALPRCASPAARRNSGLDDGQPLDPHQGTPRALAPPRARAGRYVGRPRSGHGAASWPGRRSSCPGAIIWSTSPRGHSRWRARAARRALPRLQADGRGVRAGHADRRARRPARLPRAVAEAGRARQPLVLLELVRPGHRARRRRGGDRRRDGRRGCGAGTGPIRRACSSPGCPPARRFSSVLGVRHPSLFRGVVVHPGLACGAATSALTALSVMGRGPETDAEASAATARAARRGDLRPPAGDPRPRRQRGRSAQCRGGRSSVPGACRRRRPGRRGVDRCPMPMATRATTKAAARCGSASGGGTPAARATGGDRGSRPRVERRRRGARVQRRGGTARCHRAPSARSSASFRSRLAARPCARSLRWPCPA